MISRAECEEEEEKKVFLDMLRESLLERGFEPQIEAQSTGLTCIMTSRQDAGAARQGEGNTLDDAHEHHHMRRLDPVQVLVDGMTAGDRHARVGEWSAALGRYHEAIGSLTKSTAPTLVAQVRSATSIAQRKLGSMRSALRHADLAVTACDADPNAHGARGAALEALGLVVDAHAAFVEAERLEPSSQPIHAKAAAAAASLRRG